MKSRTHDPLRLDVLAVAADAVALSGEWPTAALSRLAEGQTPPQDIVPAAVAWAAQGERRQPPAGEAEIWLHLRAQARVWLTCQRCLQPFEQALTVASRVRFVRDEAQAEALDAEIDDDVLALPRWLDLRALIEDELLLALPLVPRHDQCPQPLPAGSAADLEPAEDTDRENPFAVLQALKRSKPAA